MASIEFPLLQKLTAFGPINDPKIPISVLTISGAVTHFFLIDTGADFSVAPLRLARQVGLDWRSLPRETATGIGPSEVEARLGDLPLRLESIEFSVRCLFIDVPDALFILGRADFLDLFVVTIDSHLKRITLTELV